MTVRPKLVGINHVALEVGDIDEALDLYASLFEFELRGRIGNRMAFIDMGDQFLALSAGRSQPPDQARHFGLVVDDKEAVREAVKRAGLEVSGSRGGSLDFLDPWGNQIQVVDYREVQFERTAGVKRALGIEQLEKSDQARAEIEERGLA
jgi:lactoylglutathione lyase